MWLLGSGVQPIQGESGRILKLADQRTLGRIGKGTGGRSAAWQRRGEGGGGELDRRREARQAGRHSECTPPSVRL